MYASLFMSWPLHPAVFLPPYRALNFVILFLLPPFTFKLPLRPALVAPRLSRKRGAFMLFVFFLRLLRGGCVQGWTTFSASARRFTAENKPGANHDLRQRCLSAAGNARSVHACSEYAPRAHCILVTRRTASLV